MMIKSIIDNTNRETLDNRRITGRIRPVKNPTVKHPVTGDFLHNRRM